MPLVLKGVFGCDFCLTPCEIIVHKTKNMTVLHIFSAERCNDILKLAGECPGSIQKQDNNFQLAGKVTYSEQGEDKTGYIVHETNTYLQVMKLNGFMFNMNKPSYTTERVSFQENGEKLCYDITDTVSLIEDNHDRSCQPSYYLGNDAGIELVWIDPIRIIITKNAEYNFRLLGNYFVRNAAGEIDEVLSSCKSNKFIFIV